MLTMYDLSVSPILRGFEVLSSYLDKASAFASEKGIDPADLIQTRLAPDMFTFAGQVQRASDKSKAGIARLAQVEAPSFQDNETTIAELAARIAKTVVFLKSVDAKKFDGSDSRLIELKLRTLSGSYRGDAYLTKILMPDFYFHITTAHDILRHRGVQIGKLDYLGRVQS